MNVLESGGFDGFEIPLVEFTEVLVEHHNSESREDINAAVCGALTA
jgi:hypothetical protein